MLTGWDKHPQRPDMGRLARRGRGGLDAPVGGSDLGGVVRAALTDVWGECHRLSCPIDYMWQGKVSLGSFLDGTVLLRGQPVNRQKRRAPTRT